MDNFIVSSEQIFILMTNNNSLNVDYSLEAEMLSFAQACNVDFELAVHQTGLEGRG